MGVYFPTGKLETGGTCEFATTKCLEHCIANKMQAASQITARDLAYLGVESPIPICKDYPSRVKQERALAWFKDNDVHTIVVALLHSMQQTDEYILHWFASGDCPDYMLDKIVSIIAAINQAGYIQIVFSRNQRLVSILRRMDDNELLRVVYTTDNKTGASGLIAWPDYDRYNVQLLFGETNLGACSPSTFSQWEVKRESNCMLCAVRRQGCFEGYKTFWVSKEHFYKLYQWMENKRKEVSKD